MVMRVVWCLSSFAFVLLLVGNLLIECPRFPQLVVDVIEVQPHVLLLLLTVLSLLLMTTQLVSPSLTCHCQRLMDFPGDLLLDNELLLMVMNFVVGSFGPRWWEQLGKH